MKLNVKRLYFLMLFSLTLMVSMNAIAGGPTLYGKVLLKTPSGTVRLSEATVEAIPPGTRKVQHITYTDARGNFAFYSVPKGIYKIQVLLGTKIMKQQAGNKVIESLSVEVSGSGTKVPDILILK
jgi:hypothetical protein